MKNNVPELEKKKSDIRWLEKKIKSEVNSLRKYKRKWFFWEDNHQENNRE